jgi:hypothetical protein
MTTPNADEFTISRYFHGNDPTPIYGVTWENAVCIEDDDGEFDNDEQEREFPTLEEAFEFGKQLLLAKVEED